MSYDIAVWAARSRPSAERAQEIYEALCEGKPPRSLKKRSREVAELVEHLLVEFPSLEAASDEDVDDCAWSVDPEVEGGFVVLNVVHSQADALLSRVLELAARCPLVCYDPPSEHVYFGESEPYEEAEDEVAVFMEAPELEPCAHLRPYLELLAKHGIDVVHKVHGRSWGDAFLVSGTIPFGALEAERPPEEPIRMAPDDRFFGCSECWQSVAELERYATGWP